MLKKLSNRVHYMPHYSETDRPTLGLICGDEFSVIVDSGNSPAHARDFLNFVGQMDIAPVKFVVLTHWHWDHIFGMNTMKLLSISHDLTKEKIQYLKTLAWDDASLNARVETGEEIEFCRDMIKREMPTRDHLELKAPDISFNSKIEMDLGGVSCIVEHVGGVHAQDSSIVYIPDEKVIFLGDCIYQDFYSGEWSYDLNVLTILLDKIKKYDVDYYVTGHQDPKTHAEMWSFLDELTHIGEIVDKEADLNKAVSKFNEVKKTMPNEEQLEYIQNFVAGNQKRLLRNEA
ncbi:glyoxylase-like metal-dependent hydrolase (beta-lactamase superfamily II) [Paenibacillus castaneae]|uniref:MBL fold metallo-hydrolase n=1 Tax=Paenibacillus castaneae TaxID=474957 RepID=UPI000C9BB520|nr:MBL fold metallo-hydrolase [Paenibacillus castaneae]NIK75390.1 glyoxylase-like metal-dependent hydrolase (beta-lactamase superfamily II) [Paenibacillus castaneae]